MSHEMQIVAGETVRSSAVALPTPRVPITIRPGTMDDVPFLDSLQKLHTKQVGWMPTAQFEGKIKAGHVLIAEESIARGPLSVATDVGPRTTDHRVGYCIGNDQYFKRDDCGIIYQLNVAPNRQRGFIGAALLRAMFDRAAYGCRLFCCWCAQDIEANHFWEAMGFVPLAFRTGSRTRGGRRPEVGGRKRDGTPTHDLPPTTHTRARVHIFWQKRINADDTTTPWWFPSQTSAGSIREDRLVFPIPPGVHWKDAMPVVLPGERPEGTRSISSGQAPALSHEDAKKRVPKELRTLKLRTPPSPELGRLWFAPPKPVKEKAARVAKPKVKHDPRLVSAARELRDRWLEEVNAGRYLPGARGKYELVKMAQASKSVEARIAPALPAPLAA